MLCVTGYFIAGIGKDSEGRDKIIGKNMCVNDNRYSLCDLCEEDNMAFGGTLFRQKEIRNMARTSSDGNAHTQVDHVFIDSKWKNSLFELRML